MVADDYLLDYVNDFSKTFVDTTMKHAGEDWFTSADRSLFNAENSANDVFNYKDYATALKEGKKFKTWITENDNRVRDTHRLVNLKKIPIKDLFMVGGYPMRFPKDVEYASDAPWELVNCRCSVKYTN